MKLGNILRLVFSRKFWRWFRLVVSWVWLTFIEPELGEFVDALWEESRLAVRGAENKRGSERWTYVQERLHAFAASYIAAKRVEIPKVNYWVNWILEHALGDFFVENGAFLRK